MGLDQLKKTSIVLLLCIGNLFFFAAAAYFRQDNASLHDQLKDVTAARDEVLSEKVALQSEVAVLNNRLQNRLSVSRDSDQEVANLERLLDFREEELLQLKRQLEAQTGTRPDSTAAPTPRRREEARPRRSGNMRERMERLKEENPEEYERIQNRMSEFQKYREEQSARRELFFKNLDVSKLSREQRTIVSEYQELLTASEETANSLWQGGERPNFQEMMEQRRTLQEMSESVRKILFENLGNQTGISGENLSSKIQEILDMTSMGDTGRFMGGRGRPR